MSCVFFLLITDGGPHYYCCPPRSTLDSILEHQPAIDLVLHAGDLSYADCQEVRLPTN